MGIGNRLNDLLKQKNMTVTELSRKIGVAPTTIYSIIQRNNKKMDIDVLLDIANLLDVNVEYFRDSEPPITPSAHFNCRDFTEDELDEIRQFAELIKNRKSKKGQMKEVVHRKCENG